MKAPERAPGVSADGRAVVFMLSTSGGEVECAMARAALEAHRWLPRGADATRTLRAFGNARSRIVAIAERKYLRGRTSRCG